MSRVMDKLRSGVVRAFAGTMVVSVAARVAQLVMAILLARYLAPEGYGVFTFALGLGLVGGRVGALGWPTLMMRFIPTYLTEERWGRLKGLLRTGSWVVLCASVGFGLLVAAGAWGLGPDHRLYSGLMLSALLLPVMALRSLQRNKLAGYKAPSQGIFIDELLPPLLVCLVLVTPWITSASLAVVVYTAASAIAVGLGGWLVMRQAPAPLAAAKQEQHLRMWMAIALPALVGMSAKLLMNKTDVIMIAPLSTFEDVGLYGAALRVTYLQTFPIVVLSTVLSPRISGALAAGRVGQARRLFTGGLAFAGAFAAIFAVAILLARGPIMTLLFGADYADGAPVLAVLALSQIAASLGIPATAFLLMSGREKIFGTLTVAALILNVIGNFILVPQMGALGGALATALSIYVLVLAQLGACWKTLKQLRAQAASPDL